MALTLEESPGTAFDRNSQLSRRLHVGQRRYHQYSFLSIKNLSKKSKTGLKWCFSEKFSKQTKY